MKKKLGYLNERKKTFHHITVSQTNYYKNT